MSVTRLMMFVTVVVGVASCGCERLNVSMNYHEPRPVYRTQIDVGHICTEGCLDHYYNGSEVVVLRGHRHGYGCGHQWNSSYWVVVSQPQHYDNVQVEVAPRRHNVTPRVHVPTTHRHGPACGCVYNRAGSKWVKVSGGHIHGLGCGHVLHNGRWSVIIQSPSHNNRVKIHPRRIRRGRH